MATQPKTLYTPGPWRLTETGLICRGNPDANIAQVLAFPRDGSHAQANGRLIAAAPEMLEALEKIAAFAPGKGDVCEIIARTARAALSKARV